MEAMLALKSAPALVVEPESKPAIGRRAGGHWEAWRRLGVTMRMRGGPMASPAVEAMKKRMAPMAARRGRREDETRSEERHIELGYD